MQEDIDSLFVNEKPCMALVKLRRNRNSSYVSPIAKRIDTTYAHCCKLIQALEERDLIDSKKKGRKKFLELTEEGQELADLFIELIDVVDEENDGESGVLPAAEPGFKA